MPLLANIGNRTHSDIEILAIGMDFDVAHPVPTARRQIHELTRLAADALCAKLIIKGQNRVMIGDVKRALAPAHAGRRCEAILCIEQNLFHLSHAVAIGIAQQHHLIGRCTRRARFGKEQSGYPTID